MTTPPERSRWLKEDRARHQRWMMLCRSGHTVHPERTMCHYCHEGYMVEKERAEREVK